MLIKARKLEGFEKSIGLIGKKNPEPVYFNTRWGIHTFFMKFSIDVLILDNKNRVVALKQNLKPWRIFIWNPLNEKVIELPVGTIYQDGIKNGDKISIM